MTWIQSYLISEHGEAAANKILDDIDKRSVVTQAGDIYGTCTKCNCRISLVPPFSGLRRFPQGRGFKQWTGDDSKALMKVTSFLHAVPVFHPIPF